MTNTLGDELPRQMARIRDDLIPAYLECGPRARLAVTMMRADLDAAAAALIEGDVVAMLRVYRKLKEWEQ